MSNVPDRKEVLSRWLYYIPNNAWRACKTYITMPFCKKIGTKQLCLHIRIFEGLTSTNKLLRFAALFYTICNHLH
jgi:hypothetical protein